MSFEATAVIACFLTVAIGLAITHPEELRPFRYLKIILSIPLVLVITAAFSELQFASGFFALWSAAMLGLIWKTPFSHFGSMCVMRLITGNMNQRTGIRADVAGARALYLNGDLPDAIRHLEAELEKEPGHYEGLQLLSEMYEKADGAKRAIGPIKELLSKGRLSAEQRQLVEERLRKLEERAIVDELNSGK